MNVVETTTRKITVTGAPKLDQIAVILEDDAVRRTNFEMTAEDLSTLLEAARPVPMIALQCGNPSSVQERVNDAWAALGKKMGFDPMTVHATGQGDRFFSAVPAPRVFRDGAAWCATWPDFINLQEGPAGFGNTPDEAVADLQSHEQS